MLPELPQLPVVVEGTELAPLGYEGQRVATFNDNRCHLVLGEMVCGKAVAFELGTNVGGVS